MLEGDRGPSFANRKGSKRPQDGGEISRRMVRHLQEPRNRSEYEHYMPLTLIKININKNEKGKGGFQQEGRGGAFEKEPKTVSVLEPTLQDDCKGHVLCACDGKTTLVLKIPSEEQKTNRWHNQYLACFLREFLHHASSALSPSLPDP